MRTQDDTIMSYDQGENEFKNWIVAESSFKRKYQGKCEVVMSLGNGYLGMRSCTEESYLGQVRNTFVSGTFNKANANEVTELPNAADITGIDIFINGELFSLEKGTFSDYNRALNLKTGELSRTFIWTFDSKSYRFEFKRFVSFADLHLIGAHIKITPLDNDSNIEIKSGINGQVTNSGAQHFEEGEKRIFDKAYLQMLQNTNESNITFIHNTYHEFNSKDVEVKSRFEMDRRKVLMLYHCEVPANATLEFSKISNLYTTRDKAYEHLSLQELRDLSIEHLKKQSEKGYQLLLQESILNWEEYWENMDIKIDSDNAYDQLAIRFAMYHLLAMAPKHDSRYGIGAKGLSGEGYKGHSFWDTEIFLLPFFTYTHPEIARHLLEYRYHTIEGARKKAKENGYRGAMYPWESAWADDGEVTPVWGAADIVTGKATKIWSGFIEQHITSDVAFAVWQYYQVTNDEDFMIQYGYEILLDTGIFWSTRLEWDEKKQEYHINNVVGPDEYKEHVNNDAFTNHTARWCMENALKYHDIVKEKHPGLYEVLSTRLNLEFEMAELKERYDKVYLPQPNEDLVIPQDDTYLSLKEIDLSKYKNQEHVGSIFKDFNLDQVNQIQVSKQASVVMLMYLLEYKFNDAIKKANYQYYEPRTLHDSSLSLSTHAILAADIDNLPLAYDLFESASRIDLGPNMKTSDHGIHAASLGGIWQIIVCGFGGIRMLDGTLRLNPKLPANIKSIEYPIHWHGNPLKITVTTDAIDIINKGDKPVAIEIYGEKHQIENQLTFKTVNSVL
ncbi:glycosyl hydrolase family 65 protein [Seonamhaeicola sp.]|uniref:glycoside hydrolase family 65 protein n=1 Tax=Seonamhaeicola sp. TaxID=1912245 RepID=UPI00261C5DF4|nr:glycosyl hydrolase family 65 protein [Seonamhaeicola sp.]